jgi:gamma-glutamyltranspeptidase/glutathione hydrolase
MIKTHAFLASIASAALLAGCSPDEAVQSASDQTVSGQTASASATIAAPSAGAVSSADPRATAAGEAILARGGSATDAAIAVMLALTVVEPQSSGIGGGGFMVRASDRGNVTTYDGRETAPASATGTRFLDSEGKRLPRDVRVTSGLSVGVPGNLALAAKAHAGHGKLPWTDLFQPAIALARDGFLMNKRLYSSLDGRIERAGKTDYARSLYYGEDGKPKPVGTRIRNSQLAEALGDLAENGADAFYKAQAEDVARYVASETPQDGKLTADDISSYKAKNRDAVCGAYRGYTVCGMGPPSSGGVAVAQMLGQLERFDLKALGPDNPAMWHLFLESQRIAYADRALYIGDSDFVSVPVKGLVDPAYLAKRSQLIDPAKRLASPKAGTPPGAPLARAKGEEPQENGTSHFSVADADGNVISYTSTIEGAFGSGLTFGGFYLNNELTDFSATPTRDGKPVANRVEGSKRPRSSMAPTIVFDTDGKPFLVIGAAGGPTIPVQTARSIIGVIDFGMSAKEALALPFLMGFGPSVILEEGSVLADKQEAFKALGHERIRLGSPPLKANALLRTADGWEAADDPRVAPLLTTAP